MGKIVINRERCKACYLCLEVCPKSAIVKDMELNTKGYYPAVFDETKGCIGCAICAHRCPDLAIEKVYR